MEVAKAIWPYDLWKDLKEAQEKPKLSKKECDLRTCQYQKFHKKRFQCGDCVDLSICKCREAKEFKKLYAKINQLKEMDHSAFIDFYHEKKAIEKLSRYLTNLQINPFKRKLSLIFARIKQKYLSEFIKKLKSFHFKINFKGVKW